MNHLARAEVFFKGGLTPAQRSLKIFSIIIYTCACLASLCAFFYGLFIIRRRPAIWRSSIFRVLLVTQLLNILRCVLRPVSSYTTIQSEFGCRMLLFLNNAAAMLPVNLCIYCVIYLQMVVFYKVSPTKRWPRALLLTAGVIVSLVPFSMYLFLAPSTAGLDSFCNLRKIPDHKQYVFVICCVAIWEYFAGIIGVLSIATLAAHIIRSQKKTVRVLHESTQHYGPSDAVSRNTTPELLNNTLRTVIWFPITPIISLWLNMLLISVNYYKRRMYMSLEFVNVILLALQSFFLAIALVVNPSVRYAQSERSRRSRQREKAGQNGVVALNCNNANINGSTDSAAVSRLLTPDPSSIDDYSISLALP
ncbi:hypothetical protein GGF42_002581 [Coemansia sp. RSA 2424]|nr:hypothetical protein GGF42_002581 [Coemansia sp. RSA 2424]